MILIRLSDEAWLSEAPDTLSETPDSLSETPDSLSEAPGLI
jgi:hypothetical protein